MWPYNPPALLQMFEVSGGCNVAYCIEGEQRSLRHTAFQCDGKKRSSLYKGKVPWRRVLPCESEEADSGPGVHT